MNRGSSHDGVRNGRLKPDMNRLRRLLKNGKKASVPACLNKPDNQLPSLEQTTPRSLTLNSSIDTTYDEDFTDFAPDEGANNESNCFDPVRTMINLFSPSPKNAGPSLAPSPRYRKPAMLELPKDEETEDDKEEIESSEHDNSSSLNKTSSPDDSFDPFQEIRNMLTPCSNGNTENIANTEERAEEDMELSPQANHVQPVASFFSPFKHQLTQDEVTMKTPDRLFQAFFPLNRQASPKRPRHDDELIPTAIVDDGPACRQVVTFGELCRDARSGMAQLASSAKECSTIEWLQLIRNLDVQKLAESPIRRTKRSISMVFDSAKDVDPISVMNAARASVRQTAETVCSNAHAHPLPWAVIAAITCLILVHVLLFNQSVGTPVHQHWQFTMNVHATVPVELSSHIVDRVGGALYTEIGDDSEQVIHQVRSTMTCPLESGEEMLLRISEALKNLNPKPDIFDVMQQHLATCRENPRVLLETLGLAWEAGQGYLAAEAFDATVL